MSFVVVLAEDSLDEDEITNGKNIVIAGGCAGLETKKIALQIPK